MQGNNARPLLPPPPPPIRHRLGGVKVQGKFVLPYLSANGEPLIKQLRTECMLGVRIVGTLPRFLTVREVSAPNQEEFPQGKEEGRKHKTGEG